jgi:hypothetical protein
LDEPARSARNKNAALRVAALKRRIDPFEIGILAPRQKCLELTS